MEWLILCVIGFLLWLNVKIKQLPFDLQDTDRWWTPTDIKRQPPKEKKVKEDFFMRE